MVDLDNLARYCLVIGFVLTAITTGILFYTSHWSSICIVDSLEKQIIDKAELIRCITTPADIDGTLLVANVLGLGALTYSSAIALRKKYKLKSQDDSDKTSQEKLDGYEKDIQEKLDALQKLKLNQEGLAVGKDLHNIAKAQMELSTLFFKQQHQDIQKLSKYSKRLERLTFVLIGITVVLAFITYYESSQTGDAINQLNEVTKTAFLTENFKPEITYLGSAPITLEQQNYTNANFTDRLKFSTLSSHYLKFAVLGMTLDPINDYCDFPRFQKVAVKQPLEIYRDKGADNSDIQIPFTIDFTALGTPQSSPVKINSSNTAFLTELRVHVNIVDYQTGENIMPNVWFQTDILVHKTYENFCQ